jgi:hypothetical protein
VAVARVSGLEYAWQSESDGSKVGEMTSGDGSVDVVQCNLLSSTVNQEKVWWCGLSLTGSKER